MRPSCYFVSPAIRNSRWPTRLLWIDSSSTPNITLPGRPESLWGPGQTLERTAKAASACTFISDRGRKLDDTGSTFFLRVFHQTIVAYSHFIQGR